MHAAACISVTHLAAGHCQRPIAMHEMRPQCHRWKTQCLCRLMRPVERCTSSWMLWPQLWLTAQSAMMYCTHITCRHCSTCSHAQPHGHAVHTCADACVGADASTSTAAKPSCRLVLTLGALAAQWQSCVKEWRAICDDLMRLLDTIPCCVQHCESMTAGEWREGGVVGLIGTQGTARTNECPHATLLRGCGMAQLHAFRARHWLCRCSDT